MDYVRDSSCVIFKVDLFSIFVDATSYRLPNLLFSRVFSGIVFSAMTIGQTMSMLPDYGKAKASAFKLFKLIREPPLIDAYSKQGKKVFEF